jgi:elongation factor G
MPKYSTTDIRNVALVGSPGSGKTTLTECLLMRAGVIPQMGEIARGSTVCDFEDQEKTHGHSLASSVVHIDHAGVHVNIIDTPGYPDFLGQSLAALEAVETAAIVISPQTGIDMVARKMMEIAAERRLARMIIINKIDTDPASLQGLLQEIRDTFGAECLPINLPADNANAVADCFFALEGEADFSSVEEAHTQIVDQVVEVDEALMEIYLEQGQELDPMQLHDPFEIALREGHLIPVCFCSATTGVGVGKLLDVFERLAPNPLEGNAPNFLRGETEPEIFHAEPEADKHVLAHVFKVTTDPFIGKMGIFRIYQGRITKESQLFVGDARKPFKVGHLFKLQGKEHIEIDDGIPGDICGVAKIDEIDFDAVLHDDQKDAMVHLEPMAFPQPMHGVALETTSRNDDQKLSKALHTLAAEDPSLHVERSPQTNEIVVRGLGELHLRMFLEKIKNRYNVEAETKPPQIAYRETITAKAEGHHRHKKQTGGAGQFGEVSLRIEPLPRGEGFEFVNAIVGGVIPGPLIPAVEKGVRQVLDEGAIAGFPLQDVRVTLFDGKHHPVDSKEVAFVAAGKKAFLEAVSKAKAVVLEPIVNIDITVPDNNVGDLTGDLATRRGQINGTDIVSSGVSAIKGIAPMAELNDFHSRLKSLTGGTGSYSIEFSHYQAVPANVQKEIVSQFKPVAEE